MNDELNRSVPDSAIGEAPEVGVEEEVNGLLADRAEEAEGAPAEQESDDSAAEENSEQEEPEGADEAEAPAAEDDEPAAENPPVGSRGVEPPTSPAPTIGTEQPVAVERREGAGPVPAGGVGRISSPIGKRGRRARERAERRAAGLVEGAEDGAGEE